MEKRTMLPLISSTSSIIDKIVMFWVSLVVVAVSIVELHALSELVLGHMNRTRLYQAVIEPKTHGR
ncbi:hypothetical protein EU527_16290 [Candidatus Thorarchaeota archaeon]|nr:MAG: hypothetical protein EU527_16290 [Candidatus Thorarchaeota archaeon]